MNSKAILMIAMLFMPTIAAGKEQIKTLMADTIHVLKIAAQDDRAVIKTPDGKTQVIKPGDSLGTNGKVTEIAADRIVIEEKEGNSSETVIIRFQNGQQKVERLKRTNEPTPALYAPSAGSFGDVGSYGA
jgi:hypothetical protein